ASPSLRTVTIGMGFTPNVQFAPFYVADQRGYYRQAGLKVDFNYASSPNLLELVGAGRMGLAIADGTDAIAAVAQGVPIVYVMAEYQRFPVAIFSLAGSHIRAVAGLRGKTIGVPGLYGATYAGLLAALHAAGLHPSAVKIQPTSTLCCCAPLPSGTARPRARTAWVTPIPGSGATRCASCTPSACCRICLSRQ